MMILALKLNRTKFTAISVAFVLVIVLGALSLNVKLGQGNAYGTLNTGTQTHYNFTNIKTNEDRVSFLKQFGWQVEAKPMEIMEVQIPDEFDAVYERYNEIQKEVGLDLHKYRGQRVKRYTYKVLNYPSDQKDEVRANILVYKDRVVAGDIMTTSLQGFMQSLIYKKN